VAGVEHRTSASCAEHGLLAPLGERRFGLGAVLSVWPPTSIEHRALEQHVRGPVEDRKLSGLIVALPVPKFTFRSRIMPVSRAAFLAHPIGQPVAST
jgi:hypothetical protein